MKIIDMRVRAPFEPYKNRFFSPHGLVNIEAESMRRLNAPTSDSAKQFSMELLFQEADDAGIEKMVIPVRKNTGGRNEDLINLINKYPDRLIGLAGINGLSGQEGIDEIKVTVIEGPCTGLCMEPSMDKEPWYINDERVFPIFEFCQEHNIPIFFTFGGINNKSLRHYNPETLDDVAATFPKLKIGLAHGGWPYVTEVCQIALYRKNVFIAPDFYMIESPGMNDYVIAANTLLSDRIMFGSAYPIMPMKPAADYYINSGIKKDVLPKVMYENAKAFLGLNEL